MSSLAKSQMSKHITKIKAKAPAAKPQAAKKGGNMRKIGEATAKRMQEKAQKRKPKGFDEEIDSDMADDDGVEKPEKKKGGQAIENDPFFSTADAAE